MSLRSSVSTWRMAKRPGVTLLPELLTAGVCSALALRIVGVILQLLSGVGWRRGTLQVAVTYLVSFFTMTVGTVRWIVQRVFTTVEVTRLGVTVLVGAMVVEGTVTVW